MGVSILGAAPRLPARHIPFVPRIVVAEPPCQPRLLGQREIRHVHDEEGRFVQAVIVGLSKCGYVAYFIASRTPTLVACGAGMSRSPAIVAAAMATTKRIALADVLEKLTAGQPHAVSPGLLAEISDLLTRIGPMAD